MDDDRSAWETHGDYAVCSLWRLRESPARALVSGIGDEVRAYARRWDPARHRRFARIRHVPTGVEVEVPYWRLSDGTIADVFAQELMRVGE